VDDANIGSTTPGGSAGTATVILTGDTTADQVYVGRGSGTNGTLDLNGNTLLANDLLIGTSNGSGSRIHNGGHAASACLPWADAATSSRRCCRDRARC
jgi:hypothetical protein